MPPDFVERISLASSLHDIGKVGIPDSILLKQGPLTKEEFDFMKTHTTLGARMLAGSSYGVIRMAESIALVRALSSASWASSCRRNVSLPMNRFRIK